MQDLLERLAALIQTAPWFAPIAALVSGVLTSLMPCSLSTIPLIIGYVSGAAESAAGSNEKSSSRRAFFLSLLFALGSAIVFCLLGLLASMLGELLEKSEFYLHLLMGVLLILMALQMWGVINIIPSGNSILAKSRLRGGPGAFVAGMLAGLFASHCALPVVIALMAVAANSAGSGPLFGFLLLLVFSIGHSILSIVAGTSVGFVQKVMNSPKYERVSKVIRIVLGILILLVAVWLFVQAFVEGPGH